MLHAVWATEMKTPYIPTNLLFYLLLAGGVFLWVIIGPYHEGTSKLFKPQIILLKIFCAVSLKVAVRVKI